MNQGNYQMICADDSKTIDPSEFANKVVPGMTLEMSIILRRTTAIRDNKGKCPRRSCVNSTINAINGWIECGACSCQFQIDEVVLTGEINIKTGEEDTGKHGDVDIVTDDIGGGVEEITSPAVTGTTIKP